MATDDGTRTFNREVVAKMLVAVREARRAGAMRHKKSVNYGATVRKPVKVKGWKRTNDGAVIPPHERSPGPERVALRASEQAGPVFPEIEAKERLVDATRKRPTARGREQVA